MQTPAQQTILESLRNWYRNTIRNSKYRWLVVLGSLIYLASPFDMVPDVLPVIGWLDDGVIATLLITEVSQLLFEQVGKSKKPGKTAANEADTATPTEPVVDVKAVSVR